ncbi:tryptophan--tRNA ligase [Roseibium sp. RKSG952]|uniref:tryptophan--tRNA ligase n=1 Tax=Roseibium sp. RKSG952 TaxID=2529384 RepID=UPI0012BC8070|nr:tryptophan--tRNA ligase [Roseibium sp. RKSG952]MTH94987.1 tryptophan--tRNA ligase [Roseibium sp. RKSG952]
MNTETTKPVILTGDRPTGPLHLGHLTGSLQNRVAMQETHDQYVLIADMQALTDNAHDPGKIRRNILEVMLDYLAVGIDPGKTTFCLQSGIPALHELTALFMNFVSVGRLERNPTIRSEIAARGFERSVPLGFLNYPVSQAADITAFGATAVPVGEDQLPIIEQTNEIVRKINNQAGKSVLTECRAIIPKVGRLPAVDGSSKMSKSSGTAIHLSASPDEIRRAVRMMYTDPGHLKVSDPGKVEGNVVFTYLDAFDPDEQAVAELKDHYRRGGLGDVKLKKRLEEVLENVISPIRSRRDSFAADPAEALRILKQGTRTGDLISKATLDRTREAVGVFSFDDQYELG